jgi:hypothetical protein
MKYFRVMAVLISMLLVFAACGGGDKPADSTQEAAVPAKANGKNELAVVFSDQEQFKPGNFELKKTMAYISGMRYNAKSTAKHVYVAFANYDAKLGMYGVDVPKEVGQIVIVFSFKTANKEIPFEQQMAEYAKMAVPTGTYEPAWMGEGQTFQVHYHVGGQSGGPGISGDGAQGTATLTTSSAERVAGTIDFTSPNGSTFKGSFDVKIEKDMWKTQ